MTWPGIRWKLLRAMRQIRQLSLPHWTGSRPWSQRCRVTGRGADPKSVDWLGNSNLIRAAERARVGTFILLSALGAAPGHPMELMRMKYRAEQELKSSRLAWTIIRPA